MIVRGYRVDSEVSRDELHVLCRGSRESDGRRVLLKLPVAVSPAAVAVARREHDILAALDLRGVARAIGFEEPAGAVVLEDKGGIPLQSALALARPDLPGFFATAIALAGTVHELHALRVIHRNLSPASVLVQGDLAGPEIFDFSVASRLPHDSQAPHPLRLLPGRLAYIAPEQTGRMNRVVDHRSDLYSLGVIFYQMLTGEVPFESKDPLEIVHGHLARIPRAPGEIDGTIPAPLSALVLKLLAKTAEERYQSASGLKADLEVCAAEWAEARSIRVFPLGGRDRSDRFTIPERLYGRDGDVLALLDAFETASSGPARLMLVAGYPGVGKTSLVNEVHKPIVKRRGRFVSGKFDQLDRNIPYGALVQAFRGLIRQVLAESEETIAAFRERLAGALEAGAGVMTEVIPELEILLGPQPPTPPLGPAEAQNRFTYLFQNLIQTFAGADHPLVVFLDDLQWADPATLRLLAFLLTSPGVRSLFIIGAYRDNEVGPAHPLAQTIAELRGAGAEIDEIHLSPLRLGHLTALVADTLQCDELAASSLAQLVLRKTDGNPFFVTQFLGLLHSEGLIRFDHALGRFVFDLERIEAASITENVIDLMTSKLKKLSAPTRQAISLGACVGSSFSLRTLATVREKGLRETAAELWESIVEGLVVPTSSRYELFASAPDEVLEELAPAYRFLHDRVQQAAYALIPDGLKAPVHLRVGRLLLAGVRAGAGAGDDAPGALLFEIVNHLNLGDDLITDDAERMSLVRLNLAAGKKAKASAAFAAALDHFTRGLSRIPGDAWVDHYELTAQLSTQAAECEYLCGRYEEFESRFETLIRELKTPVERAEAYRQRIVHFDGLARYADALRAGREALALLGVLLPEDEAEKLRAVDLELEAIRALLGEREIAALVDLPVMRDPATRMVVSLGTAMWASAYIQADTALSSLISAQIVRVSMEMGNTADSPFGYATHAITIGSMRQDYRAAEEWGLVALRVSERLGDARGRASTHQQFNAHVSLWRRPFQDAMHHAREAVRHGLESGDFAYAGYGALTETWSGMLVSNDLDEFVRYYEPTVAVLERIRMAPLAASERLYISWAMALQGKTIGPQSMTHAGFDEREYFETYGTTGFCGTFFLAMKLQLGVLFEDHASALEAATTARRHAWLPKGVIWPVYFDFWESLAMAALYEAAAPDARRDFAEVLVRARDSLAVLAENCPENFRCWWLLVSAETARVGGEAGVAIERYEEAIAYARKTDNVQNEALAQELCGRSWLARGRDAVAAVYLAEAHRAYAAWGAAAKARDLAARHARLLKGHVAASGDASGPLDLASVLKAAHAIAVEMHLDDLLRKLMAIALENAGAERGVFLQNRDGALVVQAESSAGGAPAAIGQGIALADAAGLAHGVVRYVFRTGQGVVIGDAATDERFASDPHTQSGCRSILCVPVVHQGKLGGILYLENNLTSQAFTSRRVETMQILAAEAAIALENARLYDEMRQEVERRSAAEAALRVALTEVEGLKNRLEAENVYLQEEIRAQHNFEEIVGNSPALVDALRRVEKVAATDSTVLITGETGVGKELFARAVHSRSSRRDRALVKVNCGAIAAGLVESELFGHVKGAFTGALQGRTGRFELAHGGTIFLDEVGELPLETQVKLLRVLQEMEFEPVGSSRTVRINVRVIAATNRNLETAVKDGKFRQDLLYRLNVFPVSVPPLRDRRDDIPLLAGFFVGRLGKKLGKSLTGFSRRSMDRLMGYGWPGNVREMQNVIERAAVLAHGPVLELDAELAGTGEPAASSPTPSASLASRERDHILSVLRATRGVVQGPQGAANILGLNPNTLRSRMKKLGIKPGSHEIS